MRESASARGYGRRWQQARAAYLRAHPLCTECMARGRTVAAEVVDHIQAHRGDAVRFWDSCNWQSLCTDCHNRKTAREDGAFGRAATGAPAVGVDLNGYPTDRRHAWHGETK